MSLEQESLQEKLYQFLKTQGYKPVAIDADNKQTALAKDASVIGFQFIREGTNYGTVHVSIDGAQKLTVFYGDDVQNSPKATSQDGSLSWPNLIRFLRDFAFNNTLEFELDDSDAVDYDMAKRKDSSKLDEAYYPINKQTSYSDNVPNVKIRIQHTEALGENDQRYRKVARIFIENANGERFMLETKKPGLARVYARHVAEGGRPYDDKWNHINSLVEDYSKMAGFVRATKNGQFNESTQNLVNEGVGHYISLRETLHKLSGKKGYTNYFESWSPALTEDADSADLSEMFMSNSVDPRIESAMPILAKLTKKVTEMSEVTALDKWASSIVDEELTPEGNPQIDKLVELLSDTIPVGADAMNILPLLSDLNLEDDELTSRLKEVAEHDSDADAVPIVKDWMSSSNDHRLHAVVDQLDSEPKDVGEGITDGGKRVPDWAKSGTVGKIGRKIDPSWSDVQQAVPQDQIKDMNRRELVAKTKELVAANPKQHGSVKGASKAPAAKFKADEPVTEGMDQKFVVSYDDGISSHTALVPAQDEYEARDKIYNAVGRGCKVSDVKLSRGNETTDQVLKYFKGSAGRNGYVMLVDRDDVSEGGIKVQPGLRKAGHQTGFGTGPTDSDTLENVPRQKKPGEASNKWAALDAFGDKMKEKYPHLRDDEPVKEATDPLLAIRRLSGYDK